MYSEFQMFTEKNAEMKLNFNRKEFQLVNELCEFVRKKKRLNEQKLFGISIRFNIQIFEVSLRKSMKMKSNFDSISS